MHPAGHEFITCTCEMGANTIRGCATPHSPATTTRSNRGFQLSPRVRVSKMVMRNPLRRLQCEHRKRNCKSKTRVSDGTRYRRCKKPGARTDTKSPSRPCAPQAIGPAPVLVVHIVVSLCRNVVPNPTERWRGPLIEIKLLCDAQNLYCIAQSEDA